MGLERRPPKAAPIVKAIAEQLDDVDAVLVLADLDLVRVEVLEDLDDVQSVYANFDIPDEAMAQISGDA